jgi:selenocysteine-specific elongation factor
VPRTSDALVERRGVVSVGELARLGVTDRPTSARLRAGYWIAEARWKEWLDATGAAVAGGSTDVDSLRRALGAPTVDLVRELLTEVDGVVVDGGRIRRADQAVDEPPEITALVQRLSDTPLAAPDADEVAALDRVALGEAARRGRVLRLTGAVYVGPTALDLALDRLRELPAPFSVSDARQALGVSRRVAVPLLEHLDAGRRTRRLPDGTRTVVAAG